MKILHKFGPFTPREQEVARLIMTTMSMKEIAAKIGISKGTVSYYSSHIYKKCKVANRYEFMRKAWGYDHDTIE